MSDDEVDLEARLLQLRGGASHASSKGKAAVLPSAALEVERKSPPAILRAKEDSSRDVLSGDLESDLADALREDVDSGYHSAPSEASVRLVVDPKDTTGLAQQEAQPDSGEHDAALAAVQSQLDGIQGSLDGLSRSPGASNPAGQATNGTFPTSSAIDLFTEDADEGSSSSGGEDEGHQGNVEEEDEVADLLARLSALRPQDPSSSQPEVKRDVSAFDDALNISAYSRTSPSFPSSPAAPIPSSPSPQDDELFSLPAVPSSEPLDPASVPVHVGLGPAHNDIPADVDLDPFRALVGRDLDVKRLGQLGGPAPPHTQVRREEGHTKGSGKRDVLPTFFPSLPSAPPHPTADQDPLTAGANAPPTCCLCAEDGAVSCSSPLDPLDGCAGDVYCSECWVEGHGNMDREELREHRTRDIARGTSGRSGKGSGSGRGGGRKAMAA